MSKFPFKVERILEVIRTLSPELSLELVEKIISIAPNEEVLY
jgi:hypothetical protein